MAEFEETGQRNNCWLESLGENRCQSTDGGISLHLLQPPLIYQDENKVKKEKEADKTLPPLYKLIASKCYMDYAVYARLCGFKDYLKKKKDETLAV